MTLPTQDSLGTISDDGRTLTLSKEDFVEVADSAEIEHEDAWKFGTIRTIVFEHKGYHWRAKFEVHHSDGWQIYDSVDCDPVVQVERTVKAWEPG